MRFEVRKVFGIINSEKDLFNLLRTKPIYAILDGDTNFGEVENESGRNIKLQMPYLSGTDICGISKVFGIPMEYQGAGGPSRWQYMDMLFDECIRKHRCSDLLSYLFGRRQFANDLSGLSAEEIEEAYKKITREALSKINGELYFGGHELCVMGRQFSVRIVGETVELTAPTVKEIDRKYIVDIAQRASNDIDSGNLDSAITKSRTLLEEVLCYLIELKEGTPSESGDINKLLNQAKELYRIHSDANTDKRINELINGTNKIVNSIAWMRNKDSDAHGVGAKRIELKDYHARLYANAAVMLADFFLSLAMDDIRIES